VHAGRWHAGRSLKQDEYEVNTVNETRSVPRGKTEHFTGISSATYRRAFGNEQNIGANKTVHFVAMYETGD
jgi:hypothetical protein